MIAQNVPESEINGFTTDFTC